MRMMGRLVRLEDLVGGSVALDLPALEPHDPIADLGDLGEAVAHEDDRAPFTVQAFDLVDTAKLELAVHHCEHPVEDVDVRRELHRDREGKSGGHSARKSLYRSVHVAPDLSEVGDGVHSLADDRARDP